MAPKKTETERARPQAEKLANQYRAIGPAAIVAALICSTKKKPSVSLSPKAA